MRRHLLAALIVLAPAAARADVVSLRAEIHGGAAGGTGLGGDAKDEAFFKNAPHGTYGALVGVEFFFVDVWIQHHQYVNGSRLTTWTQFATGLDIQIPFGDEGQPNVQGKRPGARNYVELGVFGAFGVGTGQQVDPPLDKTEITDKGVMLEGDLSIGHRLGKVLDVGLRVPVSVGYFLKNGFANDLSNHYTSVQAEALLYMRLHIDIE